MLEPRRLTTPWASTACYRDSFTLNVQYVLSPLGGMLITWRRHDPREHRTNITYVNQVITMKTRLARRLSDLSRPGCGTKRGDQVLSFGNRSSMKYNSSWKKSYFGVREGVVFGHGRALRFIWRHKTRPSHWTSLSVTRRNSSNHFCSNVTNSGLQCVAECLETFDPFNDEFCGAFILVSQCQIWRLGHGLHDQGTEDRFLAGVRGFLISITSRPAQPPIQWPPGALFRGIWRRTMNLTFHLHLIPRLRMRGAIPPLLHMSSGHSVSV
jgi:hypothetical protein